jgi:hypothetical protein
MPENIEDSIGKEILPVNTLAMLRRMDEILRINETNCAETLKGEGLAQYKKCLWLVNQQVYGQVGMIDMQSEWGELTKG